MKFFSTFVYSTNCMKDIISSKSNLRPALQNIFIKKTCLTPGVHLSHFKTTQFFQYVFISGTYSRFGIIPTTHKILYSVHDLVLKFSYDKHWVYVIECFFLIKISYVKNMFFTSFFYFFYINQKFDFKFKIKFEIWNFSINIHIQF